MLYIFANRAIKRRLAADLENAPVSLEIHLRELSSVIERSNNLDIDKEVTAFRIIGINLHPGHSVTYAFCFINNYLNKNHHDKVFLEESERPRIRKLLGVSSC